MQQKPDSKITNKPDSGAKRGDTSTINSQPWWGTNGISHHTMISNKDHHVFGVTTMSLSPPNQLNCDNKQSAGLGDPIHGLSTKEMLQSDGSCGEEQHIHRILPITPPAMTEYLAPPPQQLELISHSIACPSYPYTDPYYGGVLPAYGPHAMVQSQCVGLSAARMALPLDMAEEPVYVNAKQYHGILRRRQIRAKAELERKLIKVRKPYLHESRHLHAMRRARGSGGRFLNTKKTDKKAANSAADGKFTTRYGAATTTLTDDHIVNSPNTHPTSSNSSSDHHESTNTNTRETHQIKAFSNVNAGNSYYARHHDFQLSSYRSGDLRRTNQDGDFMGQHRDRIVVNGTHRAVRIS